MGLAISRRLAHDGNAVGLLDLDGNAVERAAGELRRDGYQAVAAEVDVADRVAVASALQATRDHLGPIGILVTSAGLDAFDKLADITAEKWDRILAVNLTGTFSCVQSVVPDMRSAGWGRIVTISSSAAQSGSKRQAHYAASKGGVIALTKSLALELAPYGITVNTIPPGFIETPMVDRAEASGNLPDRQAVIAMTPVRRAGTVDDIATACAFLCSEDAGYVTGQALNVNGGWYL
jgi:NAD(P)-dependent dehydrogenase (short-subunit alcohol dehydrogenase family)